MQINKQDIKKPRYLDIKISRYICVRSFYGANSLLELGLLIKDLGNIYLCNGVYCMHTIYLYEDINICINIYLYEHIKTYKYLLTYNLRTYKHVFI